MRSESCSVQVGSVLEHVTVQCFTARGIIMCNFRPGLTKGYPCTVWHWKYFETNIEIHTHTHTEGRTKWHACRPGAQPH